MVERSTRPSSDLVNAYLEPLQCHLNNAPNNHSVDGDKTTYIESETRPRLWDFGAAKSRLGLEEG